MPGRSTNSGRTLDLLQLVQVEAGATGQLLTGPLVGLEQEYRIVGPDGWVDFREYIGRLDLGRRFLDPGDGFAYPGPSGAVVTCDERELEIVLPPVSVAPGFSVEVDARQVAERMRVRRLLESVVPHGHRLDGESTHVSISVPSKAIVAVSHAYTERFAAALMLLTGGCSAWGVWIRERPNRLELCSSAVDGPWLRALTVFAVGSVMATLESLGAEEPAYPARLPARLDVQLERAEGKPGWYVDRHAFGGDIYAEGRITSLSLVDGGAIDGQQHLEAAWNAARLWLTRHGMADESDVAAADALVGGSLPLPCEPAYETSVGDFASPDRSPGSAGDPEPSPYGEALRPRQRDGYAIGPVMMSWDAVVFVACGEDAARRLFIPVAQPYLAAFMRLLDQGRLDVPIRCWLAQRPTTRTLQSEPETHRPAFFDHLGRREDLLVPEIVAR